MKIEKVIVRLDKITKDKMKGTSLIISNHLHDSMEVHIEEFFKFLDQDFSYLEKYKASDND